MNTPFNSSTDAINACNAEAERAWQEYVVINKLDAKSLQALDSTIPDAETSKALSAAKDIFRYGYFAGAKWVSSSIVRTMQAKEQAKKMADAEANTLLKNFPLTQSKV